MKRIFEWREWGIWLAAGAALLALSRLALAPRLFFSSDTGLRYIQIQNLLENHFTSLAVRYAPPGLDGDPLQAPYYWAQSAIDGEIYLHISALFPIGAAAAFAAFGTLGLALLPSLGSLATGAAVAAMARLCQLPRARWIGLGSIVATPLLFYALVLWDHSAITALATWGIYGVVRGVAKSSSRALLCGGAALGLATTQRPEFGALALALGIVLVLRTWRRGRGPALWTAAGGLLGALPLWVLQQIWVGHFLGMAVAPHLFGYGDTPDLGERPPAFLTKVWRFLFYVEPDSPEAAWAFAMVVGGIACLALALWRGRRGSSGLSHSAGSADSSASSDSSSSSSSLGWSGLQCIGFVSLLCGSLLLARIGWHHAVIGLGASFPFLPLLFAGTRGQASPDTAPASATSVVLIRDTALLFCLLMLAAWPHYGGLQWGTRYLLPAYPLLCIAAAAGLAAARSRYESLDRKVLVWGSSALLVAALVLQAVGVQRRFAANTELAHTRRALAEMSVQVVATDRYFLPTMLASMTPDLVFLDIVGDEELRALIPKVAAVGMDRIAVVSSPQRIVRLPALIDGIRVTATPVGDGHTLIELTLELERE